MGLGFACISLSYHACIFYLLPFHSPVRLLRYLQTIFWLCVHANVAELCVAVVVQRCDVTFRNVAVRHIAVTVLRPQPWAHTADVFSDESMLLADFASVQSAVPIIQPDLTLLFTDKPVIQSGFSTL